MQPPMKQGTPDDFQTPKIAIYPLLPYIKKDWKIWECAAGKGNLVEEFKKLGYDIIGTDILQNKVYDFLYYKPKHFDFIVTNPPYSLKDQFLKRCYKLEKPFALLLPLTTFEGKTRQSLFKKYGIQVIFFDKRINFTTPTGKESHAWFMAAWFTYGLNLEKDLLFVNYEVPYQKSLDRFKI